MNSPFILIGNSFPLSLARREVAIAPASLTALREAAATRRVCSFWGHANTLRAASAATGLDLTPATARPVLELSPDNLPLFAGQVFSECWIVSPDYRDNFRPAVGEEVDAAKIVNWQILKITWR